MSDIAMDTPDASQTGGTSIRGYKPDLYYGERKKLKTWLLQVDRHFHLEGDKIDDSDKVIVATSYLRGDAEDWAIPIIERYMDDSIEDAENTALVEDWDAFKNKMKQNFSPFKESVIAEQKIQELRQTKSAADYTTLFQQYATVIDWDDNALMRMYKQGLKPAVRQELMRSGSNLSTLEELINETIRLDNELYQLALEDRLFTQGTRNQGYRNDRPRQNQNRRSHPNMGRQRSYTPRTPGSYQGYGAEPMHLDNLNKGQATGKPKSEHKQKKKFNCYNCGKEGHMAKDCRSKNTNKVKRQLNVLRRKSELDDNEEWNVIYRPKVSTPQGEQLLKGFEDLTITAPETPDEETDEDPETSEYDTPEEEEKEPQPQKTKYAKMASFKEKHRPATPKYERQDSVSPEISPLRLDKRTHNRDNPKYVEAQTNRLRRLLRKEEVSYHYDQPHVLLTMYHDLWHLRSDIDFYEVKTDEQLPTYGHITANIQRLRTEMQHDEATIKPNWAKQAQEDQGKNNAPAISQYWYDPNNLQHAKLHWTACGFMFCPIHYAIKQDVGRFPENVKGAPRCKYHWFECKDDVCAKHLWEKRKAIHFPGHVNAQDIINMQLTYNDGTTRECEQPHWQTCLSGECEKHQIAKEYYGYAKPQSFLGQRQEGRAPPGRSTQ